MESQALDSNRYGIVGQEKLRDVRNAFSLTPL